MNRFLDETIHELEMKYDVNIRDNGSYTFTDEKFGTIDVYHKSERLLIRNGNKWHSNACDWINKNLIT